MSPRDEPGSRAAGTAYARDVPVLRIRCPDCGHEYRSLVMPDARVPPVWTCSGCGGRNARPLGADDEAGHPLAGGSGCACCG
jgi:ribosomal protein S27E